MPTRYLKPGICDSDAIDRCSPLAECLFYRLLVNVDDYGRFDARPAVVRARCFPLKDSISNSIIQELLIALQSAKLIILYELNGYAYLQMQKWDNIPRAKESKYPAFDDDCIQTHTSACKPYTVLPVTVTETETKTGTETATETTPSSPRKKRVGQKAENEQELQAACKTTWAAYADAYAIRYAVDPIRNAKISSLIKQFVQRIGYDDSPHVAAFYVRHNGNFYVQKVHPVELLLKDAEGLRTQWASGNTMTATRAKQIDKSQANMSVVDEALALMEKNDAQTS